VRGRGRRRSALVLALLVATVDPGVPSAIADPGPSTSRFVPLPPCRLADARTGSNVAPIDVGAPGLAWRVAVAGRCGIPADATALALVVAAADAPQSGHVVVAPAERTLPPTSSLNYERGRTRTNAAVVGLGTAGIDVASTGGAPVVVDVTGAFVPAASSTSGRFVPIAATRVLDTRATVAVPGRSAIDVTMPESVPRDAIAVVANVVLVGNTTGGFVRAWPTGRTEPDTATSVIDRSREVRGANGIIGVADGRFTLRWSGAGPTHVVVDVFGWFTGDAAPDATDGLFVAADATRVLDTRGGPGPMQAGSRVEAAAGAGASAVVANTTMLSLASGWLRVGPAGASGPDVVASVNGGSGDADVVGNFGIVPVSTRGIEVESSTAAHAVVDVAGWFTGTPLPAGPQVGVGSLPPPGPSPYPTGPCDTIVPGLPDFAVDDPTGLAPATVRIGTSVEGRPIVAEYWGPDEPVATVLVVGQIHGNECAPLLFVDELRANPPDRVGVWLIPTLNPDGHATYSRYNANRIDLNKDGGLQSQPETQALMTFTAAIRPTVTVHVHSPNGQVGWYGTRPHRPKDPLGSGAPITDRLTRLIGARTGLVVDGAGARTSPAAWFLWQGQRAVWPGGESLLVELHAVAPNEVPFARPRPPHRSIDEVRAQARAVVDALDVVLG
jgi:hypothetical protein